MGLASSVARYLGARGVLLSLEAEEAVSHLAKVVGMIIAVVTASITGWLLLVAALVGALKRVLHCGWDTSALIVGGLHLFLAVILFLLIKNRLSSVRWFADTLNELKKDREWLTRPTEKD